jgi:hypothetical protein
MARRYLVQIHVVNNIVVFTSERSNAAIGWLRKPAPPVDHVDVSMINFILIMKYRVIRDASM